MKDVRSELRKCPIFSGTKDGFCLHEDCRYFSNEELCDYERMRQVTRVEDRKELERALLKRFKREKKVHN